MHTAGADFRDILRVTVYLTDVADRTRINPIRQEFFGAARPASTLIGVKELAIPGMKVEIEAVVGLPAEASGEMDAVSRPTRAETPASRARKG